jgi:hypothetical protein
MRSLTRRTLGGLVVAVTLLVLAGCGADTSSPATSGAGGEPTDPTASTGTQSASTEPTEDGCPYLTAEQVTETLGSPTAETAGSVHACFFDPTSGDGPSVMLSRVDVQIDPTDYAAQSRVLCKGDVTDVAAGDESFACVMALGPQGQLYAGRVLVTVAVNDATDDAAGIADAVALLPKVTIPPVS